ncbi:MAG: DUF2232 domain-containing protein [candidate division Zixibacteria bacterium]|nr:DUF2232 domain-containing protein [candidate division Zixibacteria bacterium]
MSHTVNKISDGVISGAEATRSKNLSPYLTVIAMFVYSVIASAGVTWLAGSGSVIVVSAMAYFLTIYLYYGVAHMAYLRKTWLLWVGGGLAMLVGYLLSGITGGWTLITGWSAILVSAALVGRLTQAGRRQQRVYLYGLVAVIVFSILQFAPLWQDLMFAASESVETMLTEAQQSLLTLGYGADAVRANVDRTRTMMNGLIRLLPAVTVLSVMMQFSIGYLIFTHLTGKKDQTVKRVAPFVFWKVPFAVTPVLIAAIVMRLFGGAAMVLAADNILLILSVYYSVAGLALMEFFLRKFNFSRLMKVLFYIMMFFSQMIGFFVAALLGFIDSFADWRKTGRLGIAEE